MKSIVAFNSSLLKILCLLKSVQVIGRSKIFSHAEQCSSNVFCITTFEEHLWLVYGAGLLIDAEGVFESLSALGFSFPKTTVSMASGFT